MTLDADTLLTPETIGRLVRLPQTQPVDWKPLPEWSALVTAGATF